MTASIDMPDISSEELAEIDDLDELLDLRADYLTVINAIRKQIRAERTLDEQDHHWLGRATMALRHKQKSLRRVLCRIIELDETALAEEGEGADDDAPDDAMQAALDDATQKIAKQKAHIEELQRHVRILQEVQRDSNAKRKHERMMSYDRAVVEAAKSILPKEQFLAICDAAAVRMAAPADEEAA